MKIILSTLSALFLLASCNQNATLVKREVDRSYIDSLIKTADTSFYKQQYTNEFAAAQYYGNRKDSVLMQIMKASDSSIRQVIVTKNNRRIYFAQFYNNGQQKASYNFDNYGSNDGASTEYYENGQVKESGMYKAGFRMGEWIFNDSTGKVMEKKTY